MKQSQVLTLITSGHQAFGRAREWEGAGAQLGTSGTLFYSWLGLQVRMQTGTLLTLWLGLASWSSGSCTRGQAAAQRGTLGRESLLAETENTPNISFWEGGG